ncbi:MAG: GIY-YIG nuclease family protein [Vicinamibacteria bacterium]
MRCADGSLYAGAAKDLEARLSLHQRGRASRYTRSRLPLELAWSRRVRSWSAALRQEALIKRLTRAEKLELIAGRLRLRRRAAARRSLAAPTSRPRAPRRPARS